MLARVRKGVLRYGGRDRRIFAKDASPLMNVFVAQNDELKPRGDSGLAVLSCSTR